MSKVVSAVIVRGQSCYGQPDQVYLYDEMGGHVNSICVGKPIQAYVTGDRVVILREDYNGSKITVQDVYDAYNSNRLISTSVVG